MPLANFSEALWENGFQTSQPAGGHILFIYFFLSLFCFFPVLGKNWQMKCFLLFPGIMIFYVPVNHCCIGNTQTWGTDKEEKQKLYNRTPKHLCSKWMVLFSLFCKKTFYTFQNWLLHKKETNIIDTFTSILRLFFAVEFNIFVENL